MFVKGVMQNSFIFQRKTAPDGRSEAEDSIHLPVTRKVRPSSGASVMDTTKATE